MDSLAKYFVVLVLSTAVFALGTTNSYANTAYLTVSNDAENYTFAYKVNQGDCSADLMGVAGIIEPKKWAQIGGAALSSLCGTNTANCKIDFYMSKNKTCEDKPVGTALFDVNKGLVSLTNNKVNGFFVVKSGANSVSISGGPIKK
ncbi:hypothetical protein B6N58_07675 [Legionella micdadei]|uniref:Uncharacterized protein n=2 Tax=Legionella micdadei TaxID=451 RepID=A0A098GEI5_LEGMI|nr:hypothetical protein B6N58_07675 [Legionella micdadei]ARH00135.1 hypothetical protein B6V88_06750 [Legionella micdadei]KTD27630.1 hypothetical protein Lmic_1950 [Legionella micdadei]CEG60884.1 exported protein of unknown function [Legionella micdadei]SCY16140.1 hypothetical protein SAMN02982997_01001 [Legionella micdadei]